MIESIDALLNQYDRGKMTRRQVVAAMALLLDRTPSAAQTNAQDGIFKARSINHFNVRVTDPARSEAFYRKLLGLPAVRPVQGAALALDFPAGGFISLCPLSVPTCVVAPDGRPGDIDHVGIGIDNFDAARVESQLKAAGFAQVRNAGPSVFVNDPDGTPLQLSAATETYAIAR
jgi:catechol 2,3-dioxygenase-like lactoylglutathione lyase family enzyme